LMRVVARREELTLRVCEQRARRGFDGHVLSFGTEPGSQTAGAPEEWCAAAEFFVTVASKLNVTRL
jgi:hypothetical protein